MIQQRGNSPLASSAWVTTPMMGRDDMPLFEDHGHLWGASFSRMKSGCPGGFEPATSTFTASHASRLHHGHSAPTRIRTRNPLLEARDDLRFTIEASGPPGSRT